MGNVALFAGDFAKFLKSNLNLFETAYVLTGTANPTITAFLAPKGSLFLRQGTIGQVYVKLDDGSTTNWSLLAGSEFSSITDFEPASGYAMAYQDLFDVAAADSTSQVQSTLTHATYDPVLAIYRMLCDKSKTVTTSGTSYTISAAPTFTLAVGDVIYNATQNVWRAVATVLTSTTGTLDVAFSPNLTTASCTLSQAVWTKDIINSVGSAAQTTRPRDFYPSTDITSVLIDYFDSLTASDEVPDFIDTARIAVSTSNDGLQATVGTPLSSAFTAYTTRVAAPNALLDYPLLANTNKQRLHNVFFCNPANGSVTTGANLIAYKISFYPALSSYPGGILDSAFAMSDGSGTEINCLAPFVFGGKTRVTTSWTYIYGINTGETSGDLEVVVDGKVLPRYVAGATLDAYYTEVSGTIDTIELWANLSSLTVSIEIRRRQAVIDQSDANTNALAQYNSPLILSSLTTLSTQDYTRVLLNGTGAFTVNLPATPGLGDRVEFQDISGTASTNIVTVGRNGNLIMTVAADDTINIDFGYITYEFFGGSIGWIARLF